MLELKSAFLTIVLYKDNFKDARHLTTKRNFRDQYADGQVTSPTENHHKDRRSNKKNTPKNKAKLENFGFLLCL